MLEVNGWLKIAEEDNWEDGCQIDSTVSFSGDDRFAGRTIEDLIDDLLNFTGGEIDGVMLNCCDEDGRIDIQVYEDEDGTPANPSQMERFKKGEERIWLATYTFMVEEVVRQTPVLVDARFGKDGYYKGVANAQS